MSWRPNPSSISTNPRTAGEEYDLLNDIFIPLAILGLIGSLLYFLLDARAVLIAGEEGALRYVCFWFLLAAVGIARIRARSRDPLQTMPYAFALAGAMGVFLFVYSFERGGLIGDMNAAAALLLNYGIAALIWWGAHRLTEACTVEPEQFEERGEGFFAFLSRWGRREAPPEEPPLPGEVKRPPRPHPGLAVLYFSLVALFLFALGQTLVVQGPIALRRHAFWSMLAYLIFALVLLSLTSLSGLRRYLRRRRVTAPPRLAAQWMGWTLTALGLILLFAALLPKFQATPEQRARLQRIWRQAREGHPTLRWAPWEGLGETRPSTRPGGGAPASQEGEGIRVPEPGKEARARPEETIGAGAGGERSGRRAGAPTTIAQAQGGSGGQQGEPQQATGGRGGGAGRQGEQGGGGGGGQAQHHPQEGGGGAGGAASSSQSAQQTSASSPQKLEAKRRKSRSFPWWLLLLLLLLLLLYLLYRYRKQIKAWLQRQKAALKARWRLFLLAFRRWRRKMRLLWLRFLRRWRRLPEPVEVLGEIFDPLADPYDGRPPEEVVRHLYLALLVYAHRIGAGRRLEQTPYEYLRELPPQMRPLEEETRTLTEAYVRASYTPEEISREEAEALRPIWETLRGLLAGTAPRQRKAA